MLVMVIERVRRVFRRRRERPQPQPLSGAETRQESDRKFSGCLLWGCGLMGIVGSYVYPLMFGPLEASWVGLIVAVLLFPTRRRFLLALLLGALTMWRWYIWLLFGDHWRPL